MGWTNEQPPGARGALRTPAGAHTFREQLAAGWRTLPPYVTAASAAAVALCVVGFATTHGPRGVAAAALLVWLAIALGAVLASAWSLVLLALTRVPRALQVVFWLALSGAAAGSLISSLGAAARLTSRYRSLAIIALAASTLGGIGLGTVLSLLQPTRAQPSGALFGYRPAPRVVLTMLALAGAIGLFIADRRIYVGLYPSAHQWLRAAALFLATLTLALVLCLPGLSRLRFPSRVGLGLAVVSGALLALPFAKRGADLFALTTHPWSADALRLSHLLLDLDRDGYSAVLGGGDCNDFNPRIHPGAREIPDNGIDDNCALGDRSSKPAPSEQIPVAQGDSPRDVVFITIDTLRPDHLGLYNPAYGPKGRATSPNIDAWAADGAFVFHNAFTTGGWTVIALGSAMRGLYPRRLSWTPAYETSDFRVIQDQERNKLLPGEKLLQFFAFPSHDNHLTLAEMLQRRHMRTIAVVDDGYSDMLQAGTGLSPGFDDYVHMPNPRARGDQLTVDQAIGKLAGIDAKQRFFMWVHVFGPHSPNERIPSVRYYGPSIADGYDTEILYMDSQVGRLLRVLAQRKPEPLVILAGDHGEVITDDNRFHGYSMEEALLRIPLIIRLPGSRGRRIDAPVSLADVFSTTLAATNTPGPNHLDAVDLLPLMHGAEQPPRAIITDCWRWLADRRRVLDVAAVTDGSRFIYYDYMEGRLYWTRANSDKPQWLSPAASDADPLARVLVAYSEEGNALPQ